jgi:predicted acylesterase/phospholipase RssA
MTKPDHKNLITSAQALLRGQTYEPRESLKLANALLSADECAWARRVLEAVAERPLDDVELRHVIAQKRALATYKDPHLPRQSALSRALSILKATFDLSTTTDLETLGLTGAIYKRRWEVDADKTWLEQSLFYYGRGAQIEDSVPPADFTGYTAINAAFLQDLLANLEESDARAAGSTAPAAASRRKEAQRLRTQIVERLGKRLTPLPLEPFTEGDYWLFVTIADALIGLGRLDEARTWLSHAKAVPGLPVWQFVSTAKQLVHLVRILPAGYIANGEALRTLLNDFLGDHATAVDSLFRGKVGLALSGGGFRASLYHIGVLAKLAEQDRLRHVEVLSCVSGGSIIGAYYYLELRNLLDKNKRARRDADVTRKDYIDLVERIALNFLKGIQENPRVRVLADPVANLRMLVDRNYSRSRRLGELYELLLYRLIDDGEGTQPRWLNGLYVNPVEKPEGFIPRCDNWSRRAKIPDLILNATTLNTGHNWQFTASWMGESPESINPEVDKNTLYRRLYYNEAPKDHRQIRLGDAVAASSCVPGLFEPLVLSGLYQAEHGEDTVVRLVDGGVYDNQGVAALLEQDCTVFIVSDASGQLMTEPQPAGGILKPLLRSNDISMQRVRGAQYDDLCARLRARLLNGLVYVHLRQGLDTKALDWLDTQDPAPASSEKILTPYGIRKTIQKQLARIRTDLDSFSDLEAFTLMTSGYHAMGLATTELEGFPHTDDSTHSWTFLQVAPAMTTGEEDQRLTEHLKIAELQFLKPWKVSPTLQRVAQGSVIALLGVGYIIWRDFGDVASFRAITLHSILWGLLLAGLSYGVMAVFGRSEGQRIMRLLTQLPQLAVKKIITG